MGVNALIENVISMILIVNQIMKHALTDRNAALSFVTRNHLRQESVQKKPRHAMLMVDLVRVTRSVAKSCVEVDPLGKKHVSGIMLFVLNLRSNATNKKHVVRVIIVRWVFLVRVNVILKKKVVRILPAMVTKRKLGMLEIRDAQKILIVAKLPVKKAVVTVSVLQRSVQKEKGNA